jgi:hypothetical protein
MSDRDEAGPNPPEAAEVAAGRRPGVVRVTLGTAMVAVLTAAAASALFAKIHRVLTPVPSNTRATPLGLARDYPLVTLLAVGLTGIVVGCARRSGPNATMLPIAAACGVGLVLIWVVESHTAYTIYLFEALFGLLFALPLLARRLASRMEGGPWRARTIAVLDLLINCFLIVVFSLVGAGINLFLLEISGG